jgi:hypothetical protein
VATENRLKELHHGLELRRGAAKTACAEAQVTTLRERLIKLAV